MAGAAGTTVPAGTAGRIGPNAITRVAEVLLLLADRSVARTVFDAAGLSRYLAQPPQDMVDETEVTRLHQALRASLGTHEARRVSRDAGHRTGDYLLAHRIPKPVQALLKRLPAPLAAHVLVGAIRRHAWTFCGSGTFHARVRWFVTLEIRGNPLCRGQQSFEPACDFYAATFERLFGALVHPRALVRETRCEARGDPQCRFEVRW